MSWEFNLNAAGYLNIIANQVHLFMAAVYQSANGFVQQDNAPCHKARIVQEWFHEHDSKFLLAAVDCPVTRSQSD